MFLLLIIGGSFLFVLVLFFVVLFFYPGKPCPCCGFRLPKFRPSQSKHEKLYGGWTCQKCGCEIDTLGKIIRRAEERAANLINDDQHEKRISQITEKFINYSTGDLLEIINQNNQRDYTEEIFEAIRRILVKRGEKTP